VAHSLTKSSLFFAAGSVVQAFKTRSMHRMRGLIRVTPVAGSVLLVGAFALVGFPPFAMFASEYGAVAGSFAHGRAIIGVAGILLVALAGVSLLSHVIQIAYREPRRGMTVRRLPAPAVLSIVTPLALMVWVSVAPPQQFRTILDDAVAVLEGR
jgi:hydrogenase-4 component F